MDGRYHPGELAVQQRAGVRADAARLADIIRRDIPPAAAEFLRERTLVFITGRDGENRLWVSPLAGPPGFVTVPDARTIAVRAELPAADPLAGAFASPADCGLLAVDFARRRRMRANGTAVTESGRLVLRTAQVFTNCPRYIRRRVRADALAAPEGAPAAGRIATGPALSPAQLGWITAADTFIVGSHAPGYGADCSHRGGDPGFTEATGSARLRWPEYPGNNMYATLGNFELDPAAALLFTDWEHGHILQLTGQARVTADTGARHVEFAIRLVAETRHRLPHAWTEAAPEQARAYSRNVPGPG
jgi:predicted pyridoxine 5'-phosphate oxidase superfamily flavin-nucleotide-binding protein